MIEEFSSDELGEIFVEIPLVSEIELVNKGIVWDSL